MGKLNYINRKSEGPKLGQIVAKDLRKRWKSTNPSSKHEPHRDTSPLEILLEGKTLTDEGALEAARGLEEALSITDAKVSTRLQHLNLSQNALTSKSLSYLAPSLRLAANDIEELNLSQNAISVETDEDARHWELFLESLQRCSALTRLNLSGNNLAGTRAFEIFARVYAAHFRQNIAEWTDGDEFTLEELGLGVEDAENGLQKLSLSTDLDNSEDASPTKANGTSTLHGRGLPSIRTIVLSDANITDGGALFLSYVHEQHKWFQSRISSAWNKHLSVPACAGIISVPNERLSVNGSKVLRLSSMASYQLKRWTVTTDENAPLMTRQSSVHSSNSRNPSSTNSHRRVSSSSHSTGDVAPSPVRPLLPPDELSSLRRKLQRQMLEEQGASKIELWATALKMLTTARPLLLEQSPLSRLDISDWNLSNGSSSRKASVPISPGSTGFASTCAVYHHESEPILAITGATSEPINPTIVKEGINGSRSSSNDREEALRLKGAISMPAPETDLIGGLPRRPWEIILAKLTDPRDILSDRQRRQIATWASSRKSIRTELESIGKPTSVQIWKTLDAMGCLQYESM